MPHIMLEATFDPALTDEDLQGHLERVTPCLGQNNVRWICSFLSEDRTRRICIHEAPDAEAVRDAYRTADIPFVRAWPAQLLSLDENPSLK